MMAKIYNQGFAPKRIVLLIEIERYCHQKKCLQLNRIALTKDEARDYFGFTCIRCEEWNEDNLAERDIPEWWEEITITDMLGVKTKTKFD
jgi:hypothetical protein